MTPSRTPDLSNNHPSSSDMATADVEAIGAHCQHPYCHQLDFLPFKCDSCKGTYCLDHRSETAHQCPKAGEWARRRAQLENHSSGPSTPRPNILTHEKQCAEPSCKTLIDTPLVTGVHCDKCNRSYCLKHRFTNDHNCANLTPLGARPARAGPTQRERGIAALDKLRAWGLKKKDSLPKTPQTKTKAAAAQRIQEIATLKKTAKGDPSIPADKRIYLYVEASSDTLSAKIPKGTFFYNRDFTVGRMLDLAAKSLQVSNLNNRSESEEDKLRVFHVEGGRLVGFGEKVGQCLQSGNTVVLLRGVGPGMVGTPENAVG
ncbi:AN1 zinc finger protein [Hortaea werneckii]|nr:AN1 zinc finger protein [Hortaea werneckii]KAI6848024.1 AN1 zinc finger protein [Hortaea werneckii]KAI6940227.1 AN1 zinc finger protein [Hortaea werneckii]KAI6944253.1 AN1 zinc finger protein [Hortaea werneckii]KAI6976827.1 AN1 zinc finger protein [Hortaea werneckii]